MTENKKHTILFVDDEHEILNALKRVFRKHYQVITCDNGQEALDIIAEQELTVLISDMRMPKMDGATLLARAKLAKPEIIRILLTGYSDMESTTKAINEGEIFSYISKPWNNADLLMIVSKAVERFELDVRIANLNEELAEKNTKLKAANHLLEERVIERTKRLHDSNKQLSNSLARQRSIFQSLLDMINLIISNRIGEGFGHNKRVAFHARMLAERLELDRAYCTKVYLAAMMHELGKVGMEDSILRTPEDQLDSSLLKNYMQYGSRGAEIIRTIPSLSDIAKIIEHQNEYINGNGYPDRLIGEQIPIGSRILKMVKDFDNCLLGKKTGHSLPPKEAEKYLLTSNNLVYDQNILEHYLALLAELPTLNSQESDYGVSTSMLRAGMVLAQDVCLPNGSTMLKKSTELTINQIEKLKSQEEIAKQPFTIFVY